MDKDFLIELLFFVFGILPWWALMYTKTKSLAFWLCYMYLCLVWLPYYYYVHYAPMGILNGTVELGIAGYGLYRIRTNMKPSLENDPTKASDKR